MKGYKYLSKGMVAPFRKEFVYELDKWYEVVDESKLKLCKYGFHFFPTLKDIFQYLFYISEDIYEVEADGIILHEEDPDEDDKYCSSRIRIVKKLEKEDIWKLIEEENLCIMGPRIRRCMAEHGYRLDILINDENWEVRRAVAMQGYGLDILVNDEDISVRVAVAEQGYGLDTLVNDKEWIVRSAVAKQGYGLDKLINDRHCLVRVAVAQQGYGLDRLINDKNCHVRDEVVFQGYGLDTLVNDRDIYVRDHALTQLKLKEQHELEKKTLGGMIK